MSLHCLDCGKPSNGIRCKEHHDLHQLMVALDATAESDAELLEMRKVMNPTRIAEKLGVSRQAVRERLGKARQREDLRRRTPTPA